MKVIKNINNNISLCLDSRNNEVVAFGKGIGFTKPPYDVPLSKIDRTFYDVDEEQLAFRVKTDRIPSTSSRSLDSLPNVHTGPLPLP